jgi:Tetratricopeptide repeat
MPVRLLIVALAIAAVVVLADRRAEASACEAARDDAFAAGFRRPEAKPPREIADRLIAHCGASVHAVMAEALERAGAPDQARRLAEAAVREEPENARAWEALQRQTARRDPERAAQAAARLRTLDPRLK